MNYKHKDMDNILNRLRQHQSATPSRWREEAEKRKANKKWLRYFQNITMHILDKMGVECMGCSQQYVSKILKMCEKLIKH